MLLRAICMELLSGDGRRDPAREQVEALRGPRAGLGGEREERQAGVGDELERLVREVELAHEGVAEALAAGVVDAHVMRGPKGAERVRARRELSDEVGEVAVVRVAARLRAEARDDVVRDLVP